MEEKKIAFDFLGGAMEVGASAILVELAGKRILLDCGIRQKQGQDVMPNLRRIQEAGGVDAIVVSHAHMDHTGTLPVVSKAYPNAKIYTTRMTMDLVRVLLYDSIKLMNRQEEGIPLYAQGDVELMLERIHAIRYEQPFEITEGVTLTLYPAGHIAGAACIFLETKEGSVFYSGDFSGFAQNTIEGIRVPRLRPDVAIVESTYGDRLHSNRQVEENQLIELVQECIACKGKMVIPAFALGRAQEVLLILRRALQKGEIAGIKIYVDGMIRDMNVAYQRNPWFLKNALAKRIDKGNDIFYSDVIQEVPRQADRASLLQTTDPVIVVASSGMLTGGPSAEYAKMIAPLENGYIVITGYQDEEAPGKQIQLLLEKKKDEERKLILNGTSIPVRCKLKKIGISAHGDKSEIEGLLQRLSSRHVFLVHGDEQVIPKLAEDLSLDVRTRIYTPKSGEREEIYLRSPRQQWKKMFPYSMQRLEPFLDSQKDGRDLYEYWVWHYEGQKFNVTELFYLWTGTRNQNEKQLEEMEKAIMHQPFFERDSRRLFLFQCRSQEEIKKEITKQDTLTQQDIMDLAREMFAEFEFRKIGCHAGQKKLVVQIDFPRRKEKEFQIRATEFQEKTGWVVTKNQEPNVSAMQQYIIEQLREEIEKISFYVEKQYVVVKLRKTDEIEAEFKKMKREFEQLTGYELVTEGTLQQGGERSRKEQDSFWPAEGEKVEQNLAFSCIDAAFEEERTAPYKRGVSSDSIGKYIQLQFLSPQLGRTQSSLIQTLAQQTGWRIRIADSVNQNEVRNMIQMCCKEHGIELVKNPSYQPLKGQFSVKCQKESLDVELQEQIAQEVLERTGLPIQWD